MLGLHFLFKECLKRDEQYYKHRRREENLHNTLETHYIIST